MPPFLRCDSNRDLGDRASRSGFFGENAANRTQAFDGDVDGNICIDYIKLCLALTHVRRARPCGTYHRVMSGW